MQTQEEASRSILEADQARSVGERAIHAAYAGRESDVIEILGTYAAKLSAYHAKQLLERACEKGMAAVAEALLPNPIIYEEMIKKVEADRKSNGADNAWPPDDFRVAVKHGNAKIVELFLPYIIKIGALSRSYLLQMIREAKEKNFVAVVDLLNTLPQVKAIEVANTFSRLVAEKDLAGIKAMRDAGFDELDTMYSALGKSIEIDDYPTFEYFLSIPALREFVIERANYQSTFGALHGERWAYRLASNRIDDTAQHGRIKMLEKFIEIDSSAVSNSGALYHAVKAHYQAKDDKVDHAIVDLLIAKTKFKVSRSMMYGVTKLLGRGENSTIEKILAKFSADAADEANKVILELVCAIIEDADYYPKDAYKILPIFQFHAVKTAMAADNGCTVLKHLVQWSRTFDRALLESTFKDYLESGKIKLEAQNKNGVLYYAVSHGQVWLVDALLLIPEVVESLKRNPQPYIKATEYSPAETAPYITNRVQEVIATPADAAPAATAMQVDEVESKNRSKTRCRC